MIRVKAILENYVLNKTGASDVKITGIPKVVFLMNLQKQHQVNLLVIEQKVLFILNIL